MPWAADSVRDANAVYYRVAATAPGEAAVDDGEVRDYFRADVDMEAVLRRASGADQRFRKVLPWYYGARMLRQEPVECLMAFICSSNNNVKRIGGMVRWLGERGERIGEYDGVGFYAFPTAERLAEIGEGELRDAGFGYRARYVVEAARELVAVGGEGWLLDMREREREEVIGELLRFCGVGRKVAGCAALMSLDQGGEVPVDVHVWRIAQRDYMPALRGKSLTERISKEVGDGFREIFGDDAGIISNVLFLGELGGFRDRMPGNTKAKKEKKGKKGTVVSGGEEVAELSSEEKPKVRKKKLSGGVVKKEFPAVVVRTSLRQRKVRPKTERGLGMKGLPSVSPAVVAAVKAEDLFSE